MFNVVAWCSSRLSKVTGTTTIPYTYVPDSNPLATVEGSAVAFDKDGTITADAQGRHFAYDNAGCLIQATSAFGVRALAAMPAPHSLNRFSRYHCAATIQRAPGTV